MYYAWAINLSDAALTNANVTNNRISQGLPAIARAWMHG
jgi:hypothetical protein